MYSYSLLQLKINFVKQNAALKKYLLFTGVFCYQPYRKLLDIHLRLVGWGRGIGVRGERLGGQEGEE